MIRSTLAFALVSLTLAGCAESTPPAAATPSYAPQRIGTWQQFCEQSWNVQHASSLAAARGAEGWELVAMYNGVLCFKRPASDAQMRPQSMPAASPGAPAAPHPQLRDPGF